MTSTKTFAASVTKSGILLFAFSLPISHVPAQLGIALAFLGWLLEGLVNKQWQVRWHFFFIPLIIYLAWNFIAAALSPRPLHSLGAVVDNEWPLIMMLMLFWTVHESRLLVRIVQVFLVSSSVAMLYALWQIWGGVELYRGLSLTPMGTGYFRAVGFYGFYLTFAGFAMSVFFICIAFVSELSGKERWRYGVGATLSFLAVVGTFARSIWLSFGAVIPLFAFKKSRKLGVIVTVTLFGLVILGIMAVPTLYDRALSIVDVSQNETRLNLWTSAITMAKEHPVVGVGQDNWDYFFEQYRVEGGYYDTIVHPHNDYLTALVSGGVPGLATFVAMWVITLVVGFQTVRRSTDPNIRAIALGGMFSIFGFLIGSLFQNYYGTFVNCLGWWFMVGLVFTSFGVGSAPSEVSQSNVQDPS